MDADEILVLQGGRVVESGSHSTLIQLPQSLYSKLWRVQNVQVMAA